MRACASTTGLLKRAFTEFRYIRCTTRRKVSSVNVFQPWREASSVVQPPYFLANAQWQNLQANTARSHAPEKPELEDLGPPTRVATSSFMAPPSMAAPSSRGLVSYKSNPPITFSRLLGVYGQLS